MLQRALLFQIFIGLLLLLLICHIYLNFALRRGSVVFALLVFRGYEYFIGISMLKLFLRGRWHQDDIASVIDLTQLLELRVTLLLVVMFVWGDHLSDSRLTCDQKLLFRVVVLILLFITGLLCHSHRVILLTYFVIFITVFTLTFNYMIILFLVFVSNFILIYIFFLEVALIFNFELFFLGVLVDCGDFKWILVALIQHNYLRSVLFKVWQLIS